MERIKTEWGQVKLTSMNLEMLCINGFIIPLDKTEEYINEVPIPDKDVIKTIVEEMLEKNDFVEGKEVKFEINCIKEDYGEEIIAFWKIRFEIVKYYGPERGKMKLVKLRFAHTKRDIPFEIKKRGICINVGKKEVQVPIPIYPSIKSENLSVTVKLLGCCIEGIYKKL